METGWKVSRRGSPPSSAVSEVAKGVEEVVGELRKKGLERYRGRRDAVAWRERDYLGGPVEAGAIVLPTKGCSWGEKGGCTMCGYIYDSARGGLGEKEIVAQFGKALEGLLKKGGKRIEYLKVFNSGSFFDASEIPEGALVEIIKLINGVGVRRLQVESRPEFVEGESIEKISKVLEPELEVGIGLETANDRVREECINKGFTLADFEDAVRVLHRLDVHVKAYLLIKPPFLGEREAIEDAVRSGREVAKMGVSRISYNPVNVQKGTLVEFLWKRNSYRPPWLWSVVEVLGRVKDGVDATVLSHPSGGGKPRGAHNCRGCDREVLDAILEFSRTQERGRLDGLDCDCKKEWESVLEVEPFEHGPIV